LAQLANSAAYVSAVAGVQRSLPLQVFNEADEASQLFQYYLLDTNDCSPYIEGYYNRRRIHSAIGYITPQ
jgi:hypothetical protein